MDVQVRLTEEKLPQASTFSLLIDVIVVFAFKGAQLIFYYCFCDPILSGDISWSYEFCVTSVHRETLCSSTLVPLPTSPMATPPSWLTK